MVFPCKTCDLECEYKKWTSRIEEKEEKPISAERFRALSKRNPKCPGDNERYEKLMKLCKERNSYNQKLEVCRNCRDRLKIITMKDMEDAPNECPRNDPVKSLQKQLQQSLGGIAEVMKIYQTSSDALKAILIPRIEIPKVRYPEIFPEIRSISAEVNTQLLKRIRDLERELGKAHKEIQRLRKMIEESGKKREKELIYIG